MTTSEKNISLLDPTPFIGCMVVSLIVAYLEEMHGGGWCLAGEIVRVGGGRMLDHPIDLCNGVPTVPPFVVAKFVAVWVAGFAAMSGIVFLTRRWFFELGGLD